MCHVCVKGRPKGVREEDVYVCEYRVDRTARRFTKIKQLRYPVVFKSYCFNRFLQKLQPKRTYIVCHAKSTLLVIVQWQIRLLGLYVWSLCCLLKVPVLLIYIVPCDFCITCPCPSDWAQNFWSEIWLILQTAVLTYVAQLTPNFGNSPHLFAHTVQPRATDSNMYPVWALLVVYVCCASMHTPEWYLVCLSVWTSCHLLMELVNCSQ